MTKTILTIAGSDTLAGGGLQSDIKTFENYHIFGVTAITCLATVDKEGFQIYDLPASLFKSQLSTIKEAMELSAIKIGLIHQLESVAAVKDFITDFDGPVVLDPVLAFKEGESIYHKNYREALIQLFPYATIITPNLKEAELLCEMKITTLADMEQAARKLIAMGAKAVVIKGGQRLTGEEAADVYFDENEFTILTNPKLTTSTVNGAGCSFASAITANLVLGNQLFVSVQRSKAFVFEAIKNGFLLKNGEGNVWFGRSVEEVEHEDA
ncbi:phosphomethylpyrimidine kinase [Enterococcus sp. AZ194]|uniref:bifunctional hydroxymethylpyrimidine kinase/phosphomethylpyrimidine kinase n=1 Tax=Enterococcus sp. AZ194 TaxID=2774629 RepID=UPI003F27DBEB